MPIRTFFPCGAALVLLGLASGGCSWLFVDGPPAAHAQLPYFDCTSSKAWPIVDTVLGASTAIEAAALAGAGPSASDGRTMALVAAGEAAVFLASAWYGYDKTSSCREAKDELMQRLYRQPMAPGSWPGPGPAPYPPPAYDPWLSPKPGAFARPPVPAPQPAAPSPPAAKPAPAPAPAPSAPEQEEAP